MIVFALFCIPTVALLVKLTDNKFLLVIQEIVDNVIIILHIAQFFVRNSIEESLSFLDA